MNAPAVCLIYNPTTSTYAVLANGIPMLVTRDPVAAIASLRRASQ